MPYLDIEKRRAASRKHARKSRKENPEKHKNEVKKWREKNREKVLAQKRRFYYKHKDRYLADAKAKKIIEKRIVVEHYGGTPPKCSCCGEKTYQFLTIDHVNGGGGKHRREIGAANICMFLIKNDFPVGFDILCYNCNCAKAFSKICPHKITN